MSDLPGVNVDLSTSPVAYQFLQDKSFVTGICGACWIVTGKLDLCLSQH